MSAVPRVRLDSLLAERGLFPSRSRAAAAVLAGEVRLGDRRATSRASRSTRRSSVAVDAPPPFVSRGGVKLANALDRLGVEVAGRRCLDVGASTGGFTDCLLQRGADARGRGRRRLRGARLAAARRSAGDGAGARRTRARWSARRCPTRPSWSSSTSPSSRWARCCRRCWRARRSASTAWRWSSRSSRSGASGSARAAWCAIRRCGRRRWRRWRARARGCAVLGFAASGLPGPAGNLETFAWLAEGGRPGAVEDLEAAVAEAGA